MACKTYSACPKVRLGTTRLKMYAGATIIDMPKSTLVSIATENASSTIAAR